MGFLLESPVQLADSQGPYLSTPKGALHHKDNIWSFDHLDTMTIWSNDAPRPNEIVVIMAISDGGRPHPRVGKGRV
jgi:hypothetical protein